jgi:uncharacterized membrane protein YfcA
MKRMSVTTILMIVVLGLLTGFMAGMLGIGGGIIVIPALVMILGFTQQSAQGTSLAMMLPPVGVIAVWNYYKAGHVDIRVAAILAVVFVVGSIFGSKLAVKIPQDVLKKIFGIFLIVVAIKMLFGK